MRIAAGVISVMVSALVLVGVTSCTPAEPPVLPVPEPTTTPLFASEDEALAAAEEAYRKFLMLSDLVISEGGVEPERLLDAVTPDLYENELEGFEKLLSRGLHSTGSTLIASFSLQSYSVEDLSGSAAVVAYVCVDISDVDLIDLSGETVVSDSRKNKNPFQASFDFEGDKLVLSSNEFWDGDDFCEQ